MSLFKSGGGGGGGGDKARKDLSHAPRPAETKASSVFFFQVPNKWRLLPGPRVPLSGVPILVRRRILARNTSRGKAAALQKPHHVARPTPPAPRRYYIVNGPRCGPLGPRRITPFAMLSCFPAAPHRTAPMPRFSSGALSSSRNGDFSFHFSREFPAPRGEVGFSGSLAVRA